MAVMELTLQQLYQQQNVINRWNFVSSGGTGGVSKSYALLDALGFTNLPVAPELASDWFSIIRTLQNSAVFNQLVTARDVNSDTDFFSIAFSNVPGVQTGQATAPFIAFGFRTNQITKKVRPGQKRLVGVRDEDTITGGVLDGPTQNQANLVASSMSEVRIYDPSGENISFTPSVCARELYTTPSGTKAYRYYATEAEQLANTAIGVQWSAKTSVRSQVSRQRGRGN